MKSSATEAMANPTARATRPTFPVPSRNHAEGFTFVEAIVALAVCVILLSVVMQALIASLRAEQTSAWLEQGTMVCDRLAAEHYSGLSTTDLVTEVQADWIVADTEIKDGDIQWQVWTVSPADRPSLVLKTAFRE